MNAEHDRETILASIWVAAFIVSLLIAIDIFTRRDCKCENGKSVKTSKK
ncbi:MAG: hypothetical protein Q4C83_02670 [Candidatus Saccharibacteria bacterium]|nr:hypothetical protein [Candidatus Saccharibacteria bacterium]